MLKSLLAIALVASAAPAVAQDRTIPVNIVVDASKPGAPVNPIWRFFGADEPNYATMKDGRTTLATLGQLMPDHVYFRTHNLFTSGDGTAAFKWGSTNIYTEDAAGHPVYNWTIIDHIFDTYRARHVKPYVELGFMPEALSTHPEPYQHDFRPGSGALRTGWAYPPKDYGKWENLITAWVTHCMARYGRAEVASWYFETWNEANLPQYYWGGTQDEFFRLHDAAVRGVRRALPEARVGGPDIAGAGDDYMTAFLHHVKTAGTPTDFLSFHAKGKPSFIKDGAGSHVRMGIADQLNAADHEFVQIAAEPAFKNKPIVIGEFDPEGCAACQGPANGYRNGTMYSSYEAAVFPRLMMLAERRGVNLEGAITWAFEFEDQQPFAGFRQLTSGSIDLPVMNAFKLFAKMHGRVIPAASDAEKSLDTVMKEGVRGTPDIGSTAALDANSLTVLLWHYHDDNLPGPDAAAHLTLNGLPSGLAGTRSIEVYRIDRDHANAYAAWLAMGAPLAPTDAERATLLKAAELQPATMPITVADRHAALTVTVPRQGIVLLRLGH